MCSKVDERNDKVYLEVIVKSKKSEINLRWGRGQMRIALLELCLVKLNRNKIYLN